jgi:hypothetical protein
MKYTNNHANTLLYDRETKTMELYEPNGSKFDKGKTKFKKFVSEVLEKKLLKIEKFNNAIKTCPRLGLQYYDLFRNDDKNNMQSQLLNYNKKHDIQGYCAMWSMYLIYLRVLHPDESIVKIQEDLIHNEKNILPFLIRNFYTKFQQFVILFRTNTKWTDLNHIITTNMPLKPIGAKYPLSPIKYNKNFTLCKKNPKNGGYDLPTLRKIGESYYYYKKTGSRSNICTYIKPFVNKSNEGQKNKNELITKCNISESKGGLPLKKIRSIAKEMGIKEITRSKICLILKKKASSMNSNKDKQNYNKLMKKCNLPESKGGLPLKKIRSIAKEMGIKEITRSKICLEMQRQIDEVKQVSQNTPQAPSKKSQNTPQAPSKKSQNTPQAPSKKSQNTPQAPSKKSQNTPQAPSKKSQNTPQAPSKKSQNTPQAPSKKSQNTPQAPSKKSQNNIVEKHKGKDKKISFMKKIKQTWSKYFSTKTKK